MTTHNIHFPILIQLGLQPNEALIYEILLEKGKSRARALVDESGLGRGNVYNILENLEKDGLVTTYEGKQTLYEAADPSKLRKLVEKKKQDAKALESQFDTALSQLSSSFTLSTGRPAIQIFEGIEGIKQSLDHSLASKTDILTYADIDALKNNPELVELNRKYVKKRISLKIEKRILVPDTTEIRKYFSDVKTPFTTIGFLKDFPAGHQVGMEIYDGSISILTITKEKQIAVLISDPNIYEMHRVHFEYLWKQAELKRITPDNQAAASRETGSDSNTT